MTQQKVYNIYGLSRSGNHAIIFWLLHNLGTQYREVGKQAYISNDNRVCYLNNVDILTHKGIDRSTYEILFNSWEDIDYIDDTNIVIHRDIINLLSSKFKVFNFRLKPMDRFNTNITLKYKTDFLEILKEVISIWKQHANAKNLIKYNFWLMSNEYRNNISKDIGILNTHDITSFVPDIGGGSSFGGTRLFDKECYLSRYQNICLPKQYIEYILSDKELIKINYDLYNIDLLSIVSLLDKAN
jgi:hypothetical protein